MLTVEPNALLAALRLSAALAAVLFLPGAATLAVLRHASRGPERAALALGLSITLWPLVLLWTTWLGLRWSPRGYGLTLTVLALVWIGVRLRRWRPHAGRGPSLDAAAPSRTAPGRGPALTLLAIVATAVVARYLQASTVVVPAWVDGLHHTAITALVRQAGQVPSDFGPLLPETPFYYHFGLHALGAAVGWLSGAGSPQVVLWLGQALSALIVLPTYALAARLTSRPVAALAAAAVPATLYYFPAYYVSWARYTQLAGLVALPVVWLLVADAMRDTALRPARIALAAVASAGLMLVHYRVFVFFALGALLLGLDALRGLRRPTATHRPALARLLAVAALGGTLVVPWLARNFARGVTVLNAAAETAEPVAASGALPTWLLSAVPHVPGWLFTEHTNGLWLRLAVLGLALALTARRRAAAALLAYLLLALALVAPASWTVPPFALAISAFLPVAVAIALGVDRLADLAARTVRHTAWPRLSALAVVITLTAAHLWRTPLTLSPRALTRDLAVVILATALIEILAGRGWRPAQREPEADSAARPAASRLRRWGHGLGLTAVLALTLTGAWTLRSVINPVTVIAEPADVTAAHWIRANTPTDARFLISSAPWHRDTYRGLDGGYWLPVLAARQTTLPIALYPYAPAPTVRHITDIARTAANGDDLTDDELTGLLERTGARYIYTGPAGADRPEKLTASRLRRHPALEEVYTAQGVSVFQLRQPAAPPP